MTSRVDSRNAVDGATPRGSQECPILLAGYPDRYAAVYHQVRTVLGDMTVYLDFGPNAGRTIFVRNIEIPRVRESSGAEAVHSPEEFAPPDGLSSNRNLGFAQATATYLTQRGVKQVRSDQLLPLLFVDVLGEAGITVTCDRTLGILARRRKDAGEIKQLAAAQSATEEGIKFAESLIRNAAVEADQLFHEGELLTSERLRAELAIYLLRKGFSSAHGSIAAGGTSAADCHFAGSGPLRINEPIILDVFPMCLTSRYSGDCTRTLCRGIISPTLRVMHEAVLEAKAAALAVCRAGTSGAAVHQAAVEVFTARGYHIGMPPAGAPNDLIFYPHGTGHGLGLETHEPPILDEKNHQPLIVGDALTIEPGLYCHALGGVRLEDLVIVQENGCTNLNRLPEALWWD